MTGTCFICGRTRRTVITALGPNCLVCADETGCHPHTRDIYLEAGSDPDNPPTPLTDEPAPPTNSGGPDPIDVADVSS
jgi:hypothetical protein